MTTPIINKQETFIKTNKNREQILKKSNHTCFDCKKEVKKDDLDVYILDINKKPQTILPLCKSCHERIMRHEENYDRKLRNMIVSKKNEKEYKEAKHRFRTNLRHAYDDMNTMIKILSEDNPGWSIKRIIKQILLENEDIGVSERSVYNHLDDQNRALVDPKYHHKPHQENIITDNNDANLHPNVIEDSSIYKEIEDSGSHGKELTDEEKDEVASKILRKDIYDYANEREISPDKKLMLTNSRLQKHPELQESLINQLVTKTNKEAKIEVAQTIMDLETGALFKDGKSYIVHDYLKDKIETNPKTEKHSRLIYFDLIGSMYKFSEQLTGYKLSKKEDCEYTDKHFEATKNYRLAILKILNNRDLFALRNDLAALNNGLTDFIDMINKEIDTYDEKDDLTKE